jgi:hypothetical protein
LIHGFAIVGVSDIRFFNACVTILYDANMVYQFEFVAVILVPMI